MCNSSLYSIIKFLELCFIIYLYIPSYILSFPDQGQWTKSYEKVSSKLFGMHKTLYAGSSVSLSVNCEPYDPKKKVNIELGWVLRQTSCFDEYLSADILSEATLKMFYECPMDTNGISKIRYLKSEPVQLECSSLIHLDLTNKSFVTDGDKIKNPQCQAADLNAVFPVNAANTGSSSGTLIDIKSLEANDAEKFVNKNQPKKSDTLFYSSQSQLLPQRLAKVKKRAVLVNSLNQNATKEALILKNSKNSVSVKNSEHQKLNQSASVNKMKTETQTVHIVESPLSNIQSHIVKHGSELAVVDMDGVYLFVLKIQSFSEEINVTVDISMKSDYGYLSAVDYPLLLFYGYMCGIYAVYAFSWLIVSALQWRDLLRIQFWIGGVILLGLIEKAVFYAEYQSINYTGKSVQGAVVFAEIFSCLKRTLARMLVIIVSLGFGIVKPRLGPMLHRVVGAGALYFILGTIEGCLRVLKPKNDPTNQALMAGIPLAVTDSAICYWIFSSLVQTNRTLRLRRNLVKLSLYQHFTNTLIFAVFASVAYMIWSIRSHKLVTCITDWKELWVDEAYWHLLFSLILLVIMILWRPTNNNQRYAFTPLLDSMDDENDEYDQNLTNDAFAGMKMRSSKNQISPNEKVFDAKQEDDLKWVEENVPSSFPETAVPSFLDSDEEIMTAKFERNKME